MAIVSADTLAAAYPGQRLQYIKSTTALTTVVGSIYSLWAEPGTPGAGSLSVGNTAAGLIPTDADVGSLGLITNFSGANLGYLSDWNVNGGGMVGAYTLFDRLYHAGSYATTLATTTLAAQPALTRSAGAGGVSLGEGTELWLEINVLVGATATTVTVTYTNSAGTAARSTGAISINGFPSKRLVPMPLQAGDTGVRKIESVIVGGVSGVAATFNVLILRRVADVAVNNLNGGVGRNFFDSSGSKIFDTSCLMLGVFAGGTSLQNLFGSVNVIQG